MNHNANISMPASLTSNSSLNSCRYWATPMSKPCTASSSTPKTIRLWMRDQAIPFGTTHGKWSNAAGCLSIAWPRSAMRIRFDSGYTCWSNINVSSLRGDSRRMNGFWCFHCPSTTTGHCMPFPLNVSACSRCHFGKPPRCRTLPSCLGLMRPFFFPHRRARFSAVVIGRTCTCLSVLAQVSGSVFRLHLLRLVTTTNSHVAGAVAFVPSIWWCQCQYSASCGDKKNSSGRKQQGSRRKLFSVCSMS